MLPRAKKRVLDIENFVKENERIPRTGVDESWIYDELMRIRRNILSNSYSEEDMAYIREHLGDLVDTRVPLSKIAMIFIGHGTAIKKLNDNNIFTIKDYIERRQIDKFVSPELELLGFQKSDFEALKILYPLVYTEELKGYLVLAYCCLTQDEFTDLVFADVNTFNKNCLIYKSNVLNLKESIDKVMTERLSHKEFCTLVDRVGVLGYEKISRQLICKGLNVSVTEMKAIQERAVRKMSRYHEDKYDYRRSIFGVIIDDKFVSLEEAKNLNIESVV